MKVQDDLVFGRPVNARDNVLLLSGLPAPYVVELPVPLHTLYVIKSVSIQTIGGTGPYTVTLSWPDGFSGGDAAMSVPLHSQGGAPGAEVWAGFENVEVVANGNTPVANPHIRILVEPWALPPGETTTVIASVHGYEVAIQ